MGKDNQPRKDQQMNENIPERVRFERCHDKLVDRVKEIGEDSLETDAQFIALINEEVELARIPVSQIESVPDK